MKYRIIILLIFVILLTVLGYWANVASTPTPVFIAFLLGFFYTPVLKYNDRVNDRDNDRVN